jgi:hypothetical protein
MKSSRNKLPAEQDKLFEKFILTFFERTGTKSKNSGNELNYITTTLDRVFKQNFGFNLDRRTIENKFEELGYSVFYKNETYNTDTKKHSPSINGEIKLKQVGLDSGIEAPYTYLDISPKTVRQLMRTTTTLTETTNETKYIETEIMRKRILAFKCEIENS